jgi:phage N-6-adenine-methyltransferase
MAGFKSEGFFSSTKQEWTTPDGLFHKLQDEFKFQVDLAADASNTKCEKYFDEAANGLLQQWLGTCWLNPPYGNKKYKMVDWIKKAYASSQDGSCKVVMLIPARTNTKWWHEYCMNAQEIKFICGRPKFGGAKHGLPWPLAIVVFGRHDGETRYSSFTL